MKLKMTLAVATLLTIGLSSAAAHADTATLTLSNPNTSVLYYQGGTVTYTATVFAPLSNGAPIFLNGDSFNVTAPASLNDLGFFTNFPFSLAPGASFTGDLFTLTLPAGTQVGTYLGTFSLFGGADGNATDLLSTTNFSITAATPEPSSIVLLLTGVAGIAMMVLWRRSEGALGNWAR